MEELGIHHHSAIPQINHSNYSHLKFKIECQIPEWKPPSLPPPPPPPPYPTSLPAAHRVTQLRGSDFQLVSATGIDRGLPHPSCILPLTRERVRQPDSSQNPGCWNPEPGACANSLMTIGFGDRNLFSIPIHFRVAEPDLKLAPIFKRKSGPVMLILFRMLMTTSGLLDQFPARRQHSETIRRRGPPHPLWSHLLKPPPPSSLPPRSSCGHYPPFPGCGTRARLQDGGIGFRNRGAFHSAGESNHSD